MSLVLTAEKREKLGTLEARKLKRAHRIPAVILSKNGNINLSLVQKDFAHEYEKGNILTSVLELELDGKKTKVIAHKVELDPVSDHPIHVDFLLCEESKAVRAKPKIKFVGQDKSPGLKKGGFLHTVLRKAEVVCDSAKNVPSEIVVDVSPLHVGAKVRASKVALPAGVKFAKNTDFLIASIIGRGKSEEEKPTAAAEGAAAPAAGAAAPAAAAKADDKKPAAKK